MIFDYAFRDYMVSYTKGELRSDGSRRDWGLLSGRELLPPFDPPFDPPLVADKDKLWTYTELLQRMEELSGQDGFRQALPHIEDTFASFSSHFAGRHIQLYDALVKGTKYVGFFDRYRPGIPWWRWQKQAAKSGLYFPVWHAVQMGLVLCEWLAWAQQHCAQQEPECSRLQLFRRVTPELFEIDLWGHLHVLAGQWLFEYELLRQGVREYRHPSGDYVIGFEVGYLAPERVMATQTTKRTDVFELAACVYALLTNHDLFPKHREFRKVVAIMAEPIPNIRELRPDIPEGLALVFDRALQKDPAARFQSVEAFADALRPWARKDQRKEQVQTELGTLTLLRELLSESEDAAVELLFSHPDVRNCELVTSYLWSHFEGPIQQALLSQQECSWAQRMVIYLLPEAASLLSWATRERVKEKIKALLVPEDPSTLCYKGHTDIVMTRWHGR